MVAYLHEHYIFSRFRRRAKETAAVAKKKRRKKREKKEDKRGKMREIIRLLPPFGNQLYFYYI